MSARIRTIEIFIGVQQRAGSCLVSHKLDSFDDGGITEVFSREVLGFLVGQEILSPEWAERLLGWRHTGFDVHSGSKSRYPDYNIYDGSLAAGMLMIAGRALGYRTGFFTSDFPEARLKEFFRIPDRYNLICFAPTGIPEAWPQTPAKKALAEIVVFDKFEWGMKNVKFGLLTDAPLKIGATAHIGFKTASYLGGEKLGRGVIFRAGLGLLEWSEMALAEGAVC